MKPKKKINTKISDSKEAQTMFANLEEARVRGRHQFLQAALANLIERNVKISESGKDVTAAELSRLQDEVRELAAEVAALPD